MATAQRKVPTNMTTDEFLAWPGDGVGGRYQLIDGEVRAMSPASTSHGTIQANLVAAIRNRLDVPRNPCRVVSEPAIAVRVRANCNLRVPHLGVSCAPDAPGQIELPDPILLIEIISPGNKQETWNNVWAYTTIPSVSEILIVQSTRIGAELLRRQADGNWPATAEIFEGDVALILQSVDLKLALKSLFSKTHMA